MAVKFPALKAGWLLFIFYGVGIGGFVYPGTVQLMEQLIWVTLILTMLVLLIYHRKWNREFVTGFILTGFSGFLLEVLGVRTGLIFGNYRYGETLGYQVWETPLMMAVTWATTLYITRNTAQKIAKDPLLVSILASLLMVLLDFFIEPFAIRHGMWSWSGNNVPLHNYIGWFVSGILIQYIYIKTVKIPENKLSLAVYLIQLAFFTGLYFLGK